MAMGFEFRPVKALALRASAGATPFEFLFLGFSFFIIVAALALVAILFRLGVDSRAREVGLLLAIGWPIARIRRVLLAEGLLVATAGAVVGVLLGIGYAWLMIVGLTTWWVEAITVPFLTTARCARHAPRWRPGRDCHVRRGDLSHACQAAEVERPFAAGRTDGATGDSVTSARLSFVGSPAAGSCWR